jgi:hypothetical protein
MKQLNGIALFSVGMLLGCLFTGSGSEPVRADGGSVDSDSHHFVTSSEDGTRIYIWETKDTYGWDEKKPLRVWKVDYSNDKYSVKDIAPTVEEKEK